MKNLNYFYFRCVDGSSSCVPWYKASRMHIPLDAVYLAEGPGAEVIKLFSCSTQLSMKFKMLMNSERAKIYGFFRFNSLKPAIYPANKC